MPEGRTVAQRVTKLEEQLAALQADQVRTDRLGRSVERLGAGAADLGEALRIVDKNQQVLTRLGKELAAVREDAATKQELEQARVKAEQDLTRRRRRVLAQVLAATVVLLVVLAIIIISAVHYERNQRIDEAERRAANIANCERRNEQAQIMADLFTTFLRQAPPGSEKDPGVVALRDSLRRFRALIADCDRVVPK